MLLWILPFAAALVRESRAPESCKSMPDNYLESVMTYPLPSVGEADTWDLKRWDGYMKDVLEVEADLERTVKDLGLPRLGECVWQDWMEHSKWNYRLPAFSTNALVLAHVAASKRSSALAEALLHWSGRKQQKKLQDTIKSAKWTAGVKALVTWGGSTEEEPKSAEDSAKAPAAEKVTADAPVVEKELAREERPQPPADETDSQKQRRLNHDWGAVGTYREDRREYLIYGLYMQALYGDQKGPRPMGKSEKARRWEEHDKNRGMTKEKAEELFYKQLEQAKQAYAKVEQAKKAAEEKPGWRTRLGEWWTKNDNGDKPDGDKPAERKGWFGQKKKPVEENYCKGEGGGKALAICYATPSRVGGCVCFCEDHGDYTVPTHLKKFKLDSGEECKAQQCCLTVLPEPQTAPGFLRLVGILLAGVLVAGGVVLAMWSM